jgi:asparagine synthase (glutamine-hydrolysing)
LSRPKQGFAVPLARWFRHELRHRLDSLVRPGSRLEEFTDATSVRRLVNEHLLQRRDHSHMLWRLLVLDLWLEALRAGDLGRANSPSSPIVAARRRVSGV